VGGLTNFCVTVPTVYSRIKKNIYIMGFPWSSRSSLSVKFVHGVWLANVSTQAIVLRELHCSVLLRSQQC
jgi:hypothetical protein